LQFFKPLNPVNVVVHYNNDGRASGEADVDFATHEEAKEAMRKDRGTMRKYITRLVLRIDSML
jgi:heterogeneous nuclear ribonucleoprotein F/H